MADLLVFAPHPDDAEIHCGGTIAAHVRQGAQVVVVDATRGELGSRGDATLRGREAEAAARVLGLAGREQLGLRDGAVPTDDDGARRLIVDAIRRHGARTVLCVGGHARHPDHIALAQLVRGAAKAAALHRYGERPALAGVRLWFSEAELPGAPTLLVPLTDADWQRKREAVRCYGSQLAGSTGPQTSISDPAFLEWIDARGKAWGFQAGAAYAEAFAGPEAPRVGDLRAI